MNVDSAQEALFGEFPRRVGTPEQHYVHSVAEFDLWRETVNGRRNAYATLSWFPPDGVTCDKVSYDFDSAAKSDAFDRGTRDDEKIELMREDETIRREVLGQVCEDVRALAIRSEEDGIPCVGVFSGFGLHVHQLFEPETDPGEKMGSVARYYRDELGLISLDPVPIGDAQRIMRVPNMKRVHLTDPLDYTTDRWECDLWTIPLRRREMASITPENLLEWSKAPRTPADLEPPERPVMPLYEDYVGRDASEYAEHIDQGAGIDAAELDGDGVEFILKEYLQLPCMYENLLLDPEPPHKVRMNSAVLLFNLGLSVDQVYDLFRQIGWRDWDPEVTRSHLEHIHRKGYSDMRCDTIQELGFCTREENPSECPTYEWGHNGDNEGVEWR